MDAIPFELRQEVTHKTCRRVGAALKAKNDWDNHPIGDDESPSGDELGKVKHKASRQYERQLRTAGIQKRKAAATKQNSSKRALQR